MCKYTYELSGGNNNENGKWALPKMHGVKRNKILNIPEASKISIERSKDILDYFCISSTDKDLIQYIEQEVLWRALSIKGDIEYIDYPYSFDVVSLFFMLLNKGVDFREIMEIL